MDMKKVFLGLVVIFLSLEAVENRGYVTSGTDSVVVIDTTDNSIVTTITDALNLSSPDGIVVTPDGSKAYVANGSGLFDRVTVLDLETNTISTTIPVGGTPQGVAITPDGSLVFVANSTDNTVSVIDTSTDTTTAASPIATSPSGTFPHFLITSSDGSSIYVTCTSTDNVVELTSTTLVGALATVGDAPIGIDILSDDSRLYVANFGDGTVSSVDLAPVSVSSISVGGVASDANHVAISTDDAIAYVTLTTSDAIARIQTSDNSVLSSVSLDANAAPEGIEALPSGGFIYIASKGLDKVDILDTSTNTITSSITGITSPSHIAFAPIVSSSGGVSAEAKVNVALTQLDSFNRITWQAPDGITPAFYRIYRDASLTTLAGTVDSDQLQFEDHNRTPNTSYTYVVVAVESGGSETTIGQTSVVSR